MNLYATRLQRTRPLNERITATRGSAAPFPLSAVYRTFDGLLLVTFSRSMIPGTLDASNWSFRRAEIVYAGLTADTAGLPGEQNIVRVSFNALGIDQGGPAVCWYNPPPFDVRALDGAEAPAFSNFPYTES